MNTPTKQQMIEAMDKATGEQIVTSMQKAIRLRMAQRYIDTLDVPFDEKRLNSMLNFLINFQIFQENND